MNKTLEACVRRMRAIVATVVAIAMLTVASGSSPTTNMMLLGIASLISWWGAQLLRSDATDEVSTKPDVPESREQPSLQQLVSPLHVAQTAFDERKANCSFGVAQVQSVLEDAVGRLQGNFSELHQHMGHQNEFIRAITETMESQVSGDHDQSISRLASSLRTVLSEAMHQVVQVGTTSVAVAYRFDELTNMTNSMLKLLGKATSLRQETTVLAMNAALEAGRAGEHGKTFGEVAKQVRHLSDIAQDFNEDLELETRNLISHIEQTRDVISEMSDFDLEPMVTSTQQLDSLVASLIDSNITTASQLQELGATQLRVDKQVGEAITSLQFEDLARQRLDQVEQDLSSLDRLTSETLQSLRQVLTSPSGEFDSKAATLERRVSELLQEDEDRHVAVAQVDVSEGDVELF